MLGRDAVSLDHSPVVDAGKSYGWFEKVCGGQGRWGAKGKNPVKPKTYGALVITPLLNVAHFPRGEAALPL